MQDQNEERRKRPTNDKVERALAIDRAILLSKDHDVLWSGARRCKHDKAFDNF